MQVENDSKKIEKQKILNVFKGCHDKLCLSKQCYNYIKKDSFFIQLRQDKKECLKYVLANLRTGQLKIDCALPKTKVQLIESLKEYEELFDLDFQELLNMNNERQQQKFDQLENLLDKIENEMESNSKDKILKHLDRVLEYQLKTLKSVVEDQAKNLNFFVTIIRFLICFRNFFTLENLILLENFCSFLSVLKFEHIYDSSFDKFQQRTIHLDRDKILQLLENILNTISCIKYLKEEITQLDESEQTQIQLCFQTLEFFYYINKLQLYPEKIDQSEFQNDEILSKKEYNLEVIRKILKASKEKNIVIPIQINAELNLREDFSFLDWSFFYSPAQKVDLLRFESKILQQFEMQNSIQSLMHNPVLLLSGAGGIFLELNLNRNNILEDTLSQLHAKGKGNNLKKTLRIKFKGEPGVDEGGLTKEFFQILIKKLFDPNFGMFETKNNNRFMWFNKSSFECNLNFELIGMLLGIALYNSTILKLNFPLAIYKKLKNVEISEDNKKITYIEPQFTEDKITLEDFKEFEPELYTSFCNLLKENYSNQQTGFTFQVTYLSWGEPVDHDLIENGGNIEVTEENKQKFVDEYLKWYFRDSIRKQFEPFAIGFHKVLTGEIIKIFSAFDLFMSICGSEQLDFNELKRTTRYEDGYNQNSVTVQHFWQILLNDFNETEQKNFLKFLTGSDRAPLRGLSDIKLIISRQGDGMQLPASHTCFNHLLLPDYQNYEKLKEKLLKSIQHFEGFGLY